MKNKETIVEFVVGEKLNGIGFPTPSYPGEIQTLIVAMSDKTFTIALKANWDKKEIKNFGNAITFTVSQINDVIDFVGVIEKCIEFDVAFYPNHKPFDEFVPFEEDTGMAFHIVFVDTEDIIIHQRLISLNTDKSNDLVKVLNDVNDLEISHDDYDRRISDLYRTTSIKEIQRNCFIRQVYRKTRY